MSKKQLKIKLLPNGEVQMETIGIKGKKCLDYISVLEKLADVKVTKQEYTNEYYEQEEELTNYENVEIQDINF